MRFCFEVISHWNFPGGSVVKNSPINTGDVGSIPGLQRSPGEEMATHSSIPAGKSNEQRVLAGYICGVAKSPLATKQQLATRGRNSFFSHCPSTPPPWKSVEGIGCISKP